jgi:tRNA A-37 threonylcarbamoyl transferase component Bud32
MSEQEKRERSAKRGEAQNLDEAQTIEPEPGDSEPEPTPLSPMQEALLAKLRVDVRDVDYDDSTRIGYGGFGAVFKGRLKKDTRVAIKSLYGSNDARSIATFRREIAVWAGFPAQRNILPLIAYCESPPLMISELVLDGNMRQRLANLGWNQDKGIEYLTGVAAGMAFLHSYNVLHGDLKCANVMIDKDVPKICDFGMAKIRELISSSSSIAGPVAGDRWFHVPRILHNWQTSTARRRLCLCDAVLRGGELRRVPIRWSGQDHHHVCDRIGRKTAKTLSRNRQNVEPHAVCLETGTRRAPDFQSDCQRHGKMDTGRDRNVATN